MVVDLLVSNMTLQNYTSVGKFTVTIDNYEYTAITDKSYNFNTTTPSRIAQKNFPYSRYSIIQPMVASYTIVVSKIDLTEYNRLMKLFNSKTLFKLSNAVYTANQCLITDIVINDTEFDAIIMDISIQEINTSLIFTATDSAVIIQVLSNVNMDGSTTEPDSNPDYTSDGTSNENYVIRTNKIIEGNVTNVNLFPYNGQEYDIPVYRLQKINNVSKLVNSNNTNNTTENNVFQSSLQFNKKYIDLKITNKFNYVGNFSA